MPAAPVQLLQAQGGCQGLQRQQCLSSGPVADRLLTLCCLAAAVGHVDLIVFDVVSNCVYEPANNTLLGEASAQPPQGGTPTAAAPPGSGSSSGAGSSDDGAAAWVWALTALGACALLAAPAALLMLRRRRQQRQGHLRGTSGGLLPVVVSGSRSKGSLAPMVVSARHGAAGETELERSSSPKSDKEEASVVSESWKGGLGGWEGQLP